MARLSNLSLLALATTVLAVPHDHQNHARFHSHSGSGSATGSWVSSRLNATGYASNSTAWSNKHTKTATQLHTSTTTVCVTETETVSPVSVASVATSSEETCPTEYTSTYFSQTTVYVTQGQSISAAAESSSVAASSVTASSVAASSVAASSIAASSVAVSSAAETVPAATDVEAAAVPFKSSSPVWTPSSSSTSTSTFSSSSPAWTPSSSSSSSTYIPPTMTSAAPTTSSVSPPASTTSEAAPASSSASPTSSTHAASSSAASTGSGKRGLAYDVADLTSDFIGAPQISWAYNWGSSSQGLSSDIDYIPMLWCPTSYYTDTWSEVANTAISNGATTLFGFNEPDQPGQCEISVADAVSGWKTNMEPFAGKAKLCAPAVTNGETTADGSPMGLNYLKEFLDSCTDCTIDCIALHWYNPTGDTSDFTSHIQSAMNITSKPIYVSEFGITNGTDAEVTPFLETVMPWMDKEDAVAGYAYYYVGKNFLLTDDLSGLSGYGTTYKTYSS